eukprot:Rmarinus@m.21134
MDNDNATCPPGDNMPFFVLVDALSKIPKIKKKKDVLNTLFSLHNSDNKYPVLRLMLPELDRARGAYGLKEATLAKMYAQLFGLTNQSEDFRKLQDWKDPSRHKSASRSMQSIAGNFPMVLENVLSKRCPSRRELIEKKEYMTIKEINEVLDEVAQGENNEAKVASLRPFVERLAVDEHVWLVKIMLKDLKIHFGVDQILKWYHPDASMFYNQCHDLERTCDTLRDRSVRIPKFNINLFDPVSPMLCYRLSPKDVVQKFKGDRFLMEMKYDGVRIQIHKNEGQVRFLTRNANDFTDTYGPKYGPIIRQRIKSRKCIIDGEMMRWNLRECCFEEFGKDLTHSAEAEDAGRQFCFLAFDVLYCEDSGVQGSANVMQLSLEDRRHILTNIIETKPHQLEIVSQKEGTSENDVTGFLNDAIDLGMEGIVLKHPASEYEPAGRNPAKWVKIKPDYVNGVSDTFDLVVLGGFYGSGSRRSGKGHGDVSHFLLGVRCSSPNENKFLTFAKVGTGYKLDELSQIREHLKDNWLAKNVVPSYLYERVPKFPDLWVKDPEKSFVLEVYGAELTPTDQYTVGVTIRFPRVKRLRPDKDPRDCCIQKDVEEIWAEYCGKNARRNNEESSRKRKVVGSEGSKAKRLRPSRHQGRLVDAQQATAVLNVSQESDVLKGITFVPWLDREKEDFEVFITKHGASKTSDPPKVFKPGTVFVVGENTKKLSLRNLKKSMENGNPPFVDIVRPSWVYRSVEEGYVLPLKPADIVVASPATKDRFSKTHDRFGDPFFEKTTQHELETIFQNVSKELSHDVLDGTSVDDAVTMMISEGFDAGALGMRNFVIYFDIYKKVAKNADSLPRKRLFGACMVAPQIAAKTLGAAISPCLDERVTHVVCDGCSLERIRDIAATLRACATSQMNVPKIVSSEWVMACFRRQQCLDESEYEIAESSLIL